MGQQGGLGVPVPCPGPASPETQGSVSRSLSLLGCTWAATVLPPVCAASRVTDTDRRAQGIPHQTRQTAPGSTPHPEEVSWASWGVQMCNAPAETSGEITGLR